MNIVKHFSVESIKFEFGNKKRLNFNDFLRQAIFKIFRIWTKEAILERIPDCNFFFETFASNRPFICNHHQTIKDRINILERIEMNVYAFPEKWTKKFIKTCHFLKILQTSYYRTCTGKLKSVLFSFIFGIRNFELIPSEL